jgi:hypothetical protein
LTPSGPDEARNFAAQRALKPEELPEDNWDDDEEELEDEATLNVLLKQVEHGKSNLARMYASLLIGAEPSFFPKAVGRASLV